MAEMHTAERLRRDAALLGPIVVLVEREAESSARVVALLRRERWAHLPFDDVSHATMYLCARRTPLVLLVAASAAWATAAAAALRRITTAPIVAVGPRIAGEKLVALLRSGATLAFEDTAPDDEIAARLMALHHALEPHGPVGARWLEAGDLRLDLSARRCEVAGRTVELSRLEYQLLVYLMRHAEQRVAPTEIVRDVWNWHGDGGLNTLRIHIARLRRKLGDDPRAPRYIKSHRSVGYEFVHPVAEVGEEPIDDPRAELALQTRLDALAAVIDAAAEARTTEELAHGATRALIESGQCDAALFFRYDKRRGWAQLVASAGTSPGWQRRTMGHPIARSFISAHTSAPTDYAQVADIAKAAKRYPGSARLLEPERVRACLSIPLWVDGQRWGDLGCVNRAPRPFARSETMQLRSVAQVLSLRLPALSGATR